MAISKINSPITPNGLINKTNEIIDALPTDISNLAIYTGLCTTAASTAAKVVTLDDTTGFSLTAGVRVAVTFQYGNSATTPTLNVNNSGAKNIVIPLSATAFTSGSGTTYNTWGPYETIIFTYTGSSWCHTPSGRLGYLAYNGLSNKANTASPTFTGTPVAPTAAAGTDTTQIATTAFVQTAVSSAKSDAADALALAEEVGDIIADIGTTVSSSNSAAVSITSSTGANCDTTIVSLTLPSAGTWLIIGACHFSSNSTGVRRLDIVSSETATTYEVSYPAGSAQLQYQVTKIVTPSTATTYYLKAGQNSGSAINCAAGRGSLTAVKII